MRPFRITPFLAVLLVLAAAARLPAQSAAPDRSPGSGAVLVEYDAQYDRTVVHTAALALDSTLSLAAVTSYGGRAAQGRPDGVVLILRSTASEARFAAEPNAVFVLADGERIDMGPVVLGPDHPAGFTEVLMTSLRAADFKRLTASPSATLELGALRFALTEGVLVPLREVAGRLVTP